MCGTVNMKPENLISIKGIEFIHLHMKFHHQEVSCRIQALWYNVMYYDKS